VSGICAIGENLKELKEVECERIGTRTGKDFDRSVCERSQRVVVPEVALIE
jgi:hypothetical protein